MSWTPHGKSGDIFHTIHVYKFITRGKGAKGVYPYAVVSIVMKGLIFFRSYSVIYRDGDIFFAFSIFKAIHFFNNY